MIKLKFPKSIIIYSIFSLVTFIWFYVEDHGDIKRMSFIRVFGATSGIYITSYLGLKLGSFRLVQESTLRKLVDKLHISKKEIISHICIIVVAIGFLVANDMNSYNNAVEHKGANEQLIDKIEETFGRNDIVEITEVGGNYVITFSDNSKKLLPGKIFNNSNGKEWHYDE